MKKNKKKEGRKKREKGEKDKREDKAKRNPSPELCISLQLCSQLWCRAQQIRSGGCSQARSQGPFLYCLPVLLQVQQILQLYFPINLWLTVTSPERFLQRVPCSTDLRCLHRGIRPCDDLWLLSPLPRCQAWICH